MVDAKTAATIDELAQAMGLSVTQMSARLLAVAVEDNEWLIRHVYSPVKKVMEKLAKRKNATERGA
jgi:hypothetical protein